MSKTKSQLKIGVSLRGSGYHQAAWRQSGAHTKLPDHKYYLDLVKTAERGKLDFVYLEEDTAIGNHNITNSSYLTAGGLEPIFLLSSLTFLTNKIGLIAEVPVTYNEPFHIARKIASLDIQSRGRAGWNAVTNGNAVKETNYGHVKSITQAEKYDRSNEFIEVVRGLWDSWEDDAIIVDTAKGVYAERDKVHYLNHTGAWFSVKGPLTNQRTPQGYPVLIQSELSGEGLNLAQRQADVIFSTSSSLEAAQDYYAEVKGKVLAQGRAAEEFIIMTNLSPILGVTENEAREKAVELQRLIPLEKLNSGESDQEREPVNFVGTPVQLADLMEEWLEKQATDGFNILPPTLPDTLDTFVEQVIPELQRRRLFREEYTGTTLREHLGLSRPQNRYKQAVIDGGS